MKETFFLAILVIFFINNAHSQYIHKIKADSVLITNDSCNAELNLENSTKDSLGFLYNKGNGRTEFRRGLIKIDATHYVIGNDTLNITGTGGTVPISNLTAAIANNTIDNDNYNQEWRWNSLTGGSGLKIFTNSTAASGNTQKLFDVQSTGANTTSGQSTYSGYFRNTHTGTSSTNYAVYADASLGSTNYSIYSINGINHFGGRTRIGDNSFVGDEYLRVSGGVNISGNVSVFKGYTSLAPILSGSAAIGLSSLVAVDPGAHATRDVYGLSGGLTIKVGAGNGLTVPDAAAALTSQLTLDDASLTSSGVIPKYSSLYAFIRGSSSTGSYNNVSFITSRGEITSGSTISNLYHLYLGDVTGNGGTSGVTNYWGVYQKGGNKNYFSGTTLVGNTSATTLTGTGSIPKLQVTGKGLIDKLVVGPATAEENGALQIHGNTFIGGTAPKIEWQNQTLTLNGTSSTGRLLLTATGTGSAFEIQHNRDNGIILRLQNVSGGVNTKPAFNFVSKDASSLTSGAWSETQTELGQYFSVNGIHNPTSWIASVASLLSYFDFYPLNPTTGVVKRTGISNNPATLIDNIETLYRTKRVFYPNGHTQGRIIIGSTTDDGNNILQVTGGVAINGKQSIGTTSSTALLHLASGTASANTAPLKFTSGTNLTTPENGAVEYDGTNYFVTSSNTRFTLAKTLTTSATLDFTNTAAQNSSDLTVTVTGVADGDAVSIGVPNAVINNNSSYSAWVNAANTVTVRFNNYSSAAIDPASGTFRISVIKY